MKKYFIWVIGGVIIILLGLCASLFWVVYPLKYKSEIITYSNKYNLQPQLVASVICVESRFKQKATSSAGACGLMQLMPVTYQWVQAELNLDNNIYDVKNNIESGCYYLRYLLDKYNNIVYVLACYNAGEGVVASWGTANDFTGDQIEYTETAEYVNRVLSLQKLYANRFD